LNEDVQVRFPLGPLAALTLLAAGLTSPWWPAWLASIPGPTAETPSRTELRAIASIIDDLARHLQEDQDLLTSGRPPHEVVPEIRLRADGARALAHAAEQRAAWLAAEAPALEAAFGLSRLGQDVLRPVLAEHLTAIGRLAAARHLDQVAPPESPGRPVVAGAEGWRARLERIRAPLVETAERLRKGPPSGRSGS
jgi:hypothetical protein